MTMFHPPGHPDAGKLIDRGALKSVQFGNVYHGGYSHSTGGYVESERDMRDQLARKADEMSERMGFECNYQVAGRSDYASMGANSPEDARDAAHDRAAAKAAEAAEADAIRAEHRGAEEPTAELVPE